MRTERTEIRVRGMICRACTDAVADALTQTRGVIRADVSYLKSTAAIEYEPALTDVPALEDAVRNSGYDTGAPGAGSRIAGCGCVLLTLLLTFLLLHLQLNAIPAVENGSGFAYLFLIGFLTSTHCAAMCGGILLSQTTPGAGRLTGGSVWVSVRASLGYNLGRVAACTAGGALCGGLGTVLTYTVQTKSMVFTMLGLIVALLGLNMWGIIPGLRALMPQQRGFCALSPKSKKLAAGRPVLIGLLTALMPCGALCSMWFYAVSLGSAAAGAVSMLAFSLGTVPLMFLFGCAGSLFRGKNARYLLKLSAVLITAMGFKMLISGLMLVL